jgi:predicted Zn-dependent peptidase
LTETRLDTLPNGLRVVTEHMPGLASAALGVWVCVGGRDEREDENGVAHFLEHMAFKGTERRSALEIAEAIEDVGGYMNAYTSRDATAYYARVLEEDVPLAMDVIADILLAPAFAADEIEVERGVILQEIGQALDTPDDIVFDWLQEAAYPGQPFGRPILGPAERVAGFGRDDLARFVHEHYAPGQMIVAAAGAVDHERLMRLAERHFGHLQSRNAPLPSPAVFQGGEMRRDKPLEQAHMALAFEAPSYSDPLLYASQVWSVALGGGMSSRLFQEIREKRGLCYTIFAQAGAHADTGSLTIYAGTGAEALGDLATLTFDEMKRAAEDMTEAELSRARAQMKAGLLMGLESPSNRAERLARMVQVWGAVPTVEETAAKIDAVTRADLRAVGERIAAQAPMALALYGPLGRAPGYEALQARRAA